MALTTRDLEILSAAFQCLRDPDAFKVGQLIAMKGASCHSISLSITIHPKLSLLLRTHAISLSITNHLKLCLLLEKHSSQSITMSLELTSLRAQVDYQKLATLAGFKSAASASNSFFLVKKKINAGAGAMAKANAAEKDSGDNADGDEAGGPNHIEGSTTPLTPAAKKRVRKAKAPPTSAEDTNGVDNGVDNGEENGDEPTVPTPSSPKKRARKPKAEPQSGDEATTPKKRARKAAKPKAGEEAKALTPHSGGDEDSVLPTPASPSPAKKRARKPSSAKRAKKSAEIVIGDATTNEAENSATAATTIVDTNAKLGDGDNQYTVAIFCPDVTPNKAGTSAVLAAEIAAAAVNEYSKGGQTEFLALVAGNDDVPADEMDHNTEGETSYAAGHGVTLA